MVTSVSQRVNFLVRVWGSFLDEILTKTLWYVHALYCKISWKFKNTVFWDMTPHILVGYQCFGRMYCIHLQSQNKKFWEELIAYFPWYDTGHIENDTSNNSSIVTCVFVTAVTFLPSRCLATIGRFLPSRWLATIGGIHTHTQTATWSHKPTLFFQNKDSRLRSKPSKQTAN
jgi:hypothetical protein